MDNTTLMNKHLSSLLEEGEHLSYSVYGFYKQGIYQAYSYLGFCEDHLLLVHLRLNKIDRSFRIPLESIHEVRIVERNTLLGKKIEIFITLKADGELVTFSVTCPVKCKTVSTQEENLPRFIQNFKNTVPTVEAVKLSETAGKKVRVQYFTWILYFFYAVASFVFAWLPLFTYIKDGSFNYKEAVMNVTGLFAVMGVVIVALALLNRFIFGKVICIVTDEAFVFDESSIPYKKIKDFRYSPRLPSKRGYSSSYGTFTVEKNEEELEVFKAAKLPFYAVFELKKRAPHVKIKFDTIGIVEIILAIVLPIAVCAYLVFFA